MSRLLSKNHSKQIADLLNKHNNLPTKYSQFKIRNSPVLYLPLVYKDTVVGSVGLYRWSFLITEIKHLVVAPSARGIRLGRHLVERAEEKISTPLSCATVRKSNQASLKTFLNIGYKRVTNVENKGNEIVFLIKKL